MKEDNLNSLDKGLLCGLKHSFHIFTTTSMISNSNESNVTFIFLNIAIPLSSAAYLLGFAVTALCKGRKMVANQEKQ